jgi:hypothetical protein
MFEKQAFRSIIRDCKSNSEAKRFKHDRIANFLQGTRDNIEDS